MALSLHLQRCPRFFPRLKKRSIIDCVSNCRIVVLRRLEGQHHLRDPYLGPVSCPSRKKGVYSRVNAVGQPYATPVGFANRQDSFPLSKIDTNHPLEQRAQEKVVVSTRTYETAKDSPTCTPRCVWRCG